MKLHHALLAAAAAALLAACGDSPADAPAPPPPAASNEVPASAQVSPMAYAEYAASLPKTETEAPVDVNKVKPPTSETALPVSF